MKFIQKQVYSELLKRRFENYGAERDRRLDLFVSPLFFFVRWLPQSATFPWWLQWRKFFLHRSVDVFERKELNERVASATRVVAGGRVTSTPKRSNIV